MRHVFGDQDDPSVATPASPSSSKYTTDKKDGDGAYSSANVEPWQKEEFKTTRNVTGGVTLATEMTINMLDKVHPAVHLAVLLPGGTCALLTFMEKKGL